MGALRQSCWPLSQFIMFFSSQLSLNLGMVTALFFNCEMWLQRSFYLAMPASNVFFSRKEFPITRLRSHYIHSLGCPLNGQFFCLIRNYSPRIISMWFFNSHKLKCACTITQCRSYSNSDAHQVVNHFDIRNGYNIDRKTWDVSSLNRNRHTQKLIDMWWKEQVLRSIVILCKKGIK